MRLQHTHSAALFLLHHGRRPVGGFSLLQLALLVSFVTALSHSLHFRVTLALSES